MQIVACQLDIVWEDKPANYRKVQEMARAAELSPGDMLVLPEMFATGFSMNVEAVAEPLEGPTSRFLSDLAAKHRAFVIGGVAVREADGAHNEALVYGPQGRLASRYVKMHPFSMIKEHDFYPAGPDVTCFDWAGICVAPTICYDLRFPEVYRRAASRGAEALIDIANWPVARVDHWMTLLKARAIENQAYVVGVNRSGRDPQFVYPGRSQIIDPHGNIIADAGDAEGIIRADIDPQAVRDWRQKFPALRDRRGDFFK